MPARRALRSAQRSTRSGKRLPVTSKFPYSSFSNLLLAPVSKKSSVKKSKTSVQKAKKSIKSKAKATRAAKKKKMPVSKAKTTKKTKTASKSQKKASKAPKNPLGGYSASELKKYKGILFLSNF